MIISADQFWQATQGSIEVDLRGGPDALPKKLWLPAELAAAEKLKIRYLGGYEHYERTAPDGAGVVLTWRMHTRIAE